MRVQCYFEGDDPTTRGCVWNLSPAEPTQKHLSPADAAQKHADKYGQDVEPQHVYVEPLDDEARALPGWSADDAGLKIKRFVVTPKTVWTAREVATFNLRITGSEPAPPLET